MLRGFKKKVSIAICYLFMLTSILQGTYINVHAESSGITDKPLIAVDGQIIIGLRDSKYDGYMKILNEYNGKVLNNAGQDILVQVSSDSVKNALTELKEDNNVTFAEVNAVGKKQGETAYLGDDLDYLYYSHAQEAWSLLPDISLQQAVTVAVVDSGIKANHPGLSGKILTNGKNFIDNSSNTDDTNGHGTQVAGIIASNSTDGIGSIGIAGRANVKLLPVKVLDDKGNGTSFNIAQGIRYAADNNASIINVSICGEGYSQTIQDAVDYAVNTKGCMVICSAGDQNDYAENYWPCNSTGAIVIADSWSRNSNHGKVITAAVCGEGKTTTIGNSQYCHVSGSSFAAAVASGAAALGKIKFPSDTNSQLENLLKNTSSAMDNSDVKYNHNNGYGIINAYAFLTGTNTPIEIVSPQTQINSNSDVSLNVKAITPSDISKLEVYLNDLPSPVTTITGNSSKNYTYTIAMSNLIDGENKVSVKAYCKSGSTYTDIRYFREYKTKDHNFSIILKGNTGNPIPKGTKVYLLDQNFNRIAADTADQNGSVNFYGTNLNTNYEIYYSYNNLDTTTNINHPVFFQTQINSSNLPQIIDGSSLLRKITLSAKKADGTPLLNSEIYCGFDKGTDFDGIFDSTGNGYIWCNDNINQDFRLVNDSEGYILDKTFPNTIKGISSINFAVDSTVTKVSISDNSLSGITSQLFSVKGLDDKGNYILTTVSVKNGAVYLSKNMDYVYYYENHVNYNNNDWQNAYTPEAIHTGNQSNLGINYGKPKLNNGSGDGWEDKFHNTVYEFNCILKDDYNHVLYYKPGQQINLNVLNSKGVSVDNTSYNVTDYSQVQFSLTYIMKKSFPSDIYSFNLSANIGPFGTINAVYPENINYTNNDISDSSILVDIKSPVATDKNYIAEYVIYDSNGSIVLNGYAQYDSIENAATAKIDKKYFAANYFIKLYNSKFMYYRSMPAVPSSKVIFDNSANTAKPIKVTIDDPAKINLLNLSSEFIIDSSHDHERIFIENPTISNGIVNTNFYLDNGSYDLTMENHNDNYLLSSSFVVNDTNSTACLNTSGLIKIGVNASNVSGYVSSDVSFLIYQSSGYCNISSFDIKKGGVLTASSSLKPTVNHIFEKSIDDSTGNIYYYGYNSNNNNSNLQTPISTDTTVNLDNFTFNFTSQTNNVDMPASITSSYTIQTGNFILQRINKETLFDFMNEIKNDHDSLSFNLSNSSNQIIRSTSWGKYSGLTLETSQNYTDYTIPKGTYTASIMLPKNALNVTNNTFKVSVTTDNLQIMKVMNPFDLAKPAVNAVVSINGSWYNTDTNGCIYVNKNSIGQASNIQIKYYDKNNDSTVIFNPDSVTPDVNGIIQICKSISGLKKLSIDCSVMPSTFLGNICISTSNGNNIYSSSIYNQVTNLYLNTGSYSLQISNQWQDLPEKYFISKSIDLSADANIKIDKSQLHKTTINNNGQSIQGINIMIFDPANPNSNISQWCNPNTNVIYFSSGLNINASININNCINNNISYTTSQNGSNVINIGKSYTVTASNVSSTLPPDGQISAVLNITDEYSNNLSLLNNPSSSNNQGIFAVINQNGQDIETLPQDMRGPSNTYLFDLKSDITGNVQVKFLIDMGSMGKITSPSYPLNISIDGYTKLTIKDPLGANAANGTVQLGQVTAWSNQFNLSNTYKISQDGSIYIKNSDLDSSAKYKLLIYGSTATSTSSTNDLFVYYRDLDLNNTTYLSQNTAKVNVKSALNYSSVNGNVFLETDGYYVNLKDFSYSGNSDSNSVNTNNWNNWNDFNIYTDKGIYNLSMYANCFNVNEGNSSYILCQNGINTANNSNISFDNSNLSRIKVICDAPNTNISSYYVSLRNSQYNSNEISTDIAIYASKMTFKDAEIRCYDKQYNSYFFTKNNLLVKDSVTEIHFGKSPFNANSDNYKNGQNINVPSCAVVNDSINLRNPLTDANGFSIDLSCNMTVKFSQNGIVPSGGLITDASWSFNVPSLPEGYYDLEAYVDTPFGKLETINQKIYIVPDSSSIINCPYSGNGIFTIYSGDTKIFTCNSTNGNGYIPKSLLDTSKTYTFNVASSTELYSGQLYYDSSNNNWSLKNADGYNATVNLLNINSNINLFSYSITNSKGQSTCGNLWGSSLNMNLAADNYKVVIKGSDSDGNVYVIEKAITVAANSANQFDTDMAGLCKLNITNSFNETPYSSSYDIANMDNSMSCTLNDYELKTGIVYISKANYTINANFSFAGVANNIKGAYNVNCTNSTASFTPGSAITASVQADKASYNVGDTLSYTANVKDGSTVLSGFTQSDFSVSGIDIMHRGKTIKTFSDTIPDFLKGECNLKLNTVNSLLGNVSGLSTVTVNNLGSVLDGDINLDGIVDIYDLVLIAKDFGMTKAASADWDGRCNLDNSDNANKIDIKDIAKAALNYNKKQ